MPPVAASLFDLSATATAPGGDGLAAQPAGQSGGGAFGALLAVIPPAGDAAATLPALPTFGIRPMLLPADGIALTMTQADMPPATQAGTQPTLPPAVPQEMAEAVAPDPTGMVVPPPAAPAVAASPPAATPAQPTQAPPADGLPAVKPPLRPAGPEAAPVADPRLAALALATAMAGVGADTAKVMSVPTRRAVDADADVDADAGGDAEPAADTESAADPATAAGAIAAAVATPLPARTADPAAAPPPAAPEQRVTATGDHRRDPSSPGNGDPAPSSGAASPDPAAAAPAPRDAAPVFTLPGTAALGSVRSAVTPGTITAQPGRIGQELGVAIARHVGAGGATGGGETITLRLNPADMGRIEVQLSFDDGGTLRAVVSADNPVALDLLRRDSADLGRALADAGVRSDPQTLRFDTRAGTGQGGDGRPAGQPWQRPSDPRNATADPLTETPEDIAAAYRPLRTRGRIDMVA